MKYTGSTYQLGRELGISRGQSINVAATPSELAAVERATLAMIEAVRAAVIGNDAADSYELELYVDGVRDGQNYAMGRASKLEEGLRRGLEAVDRAAREDSCGVDADELATAYVEAERRAYGA